MSVELAKVLGYVVVWGQSDTAHHPLDAPYNSVVS
jgi:hypothetical protein